MTAQRKQAIPDATVEKARSADLVGLVEKHTGKPMRKVGNEYEACCPFHDDSTPSFRVFFGDGGVWRFHCFGCQADGDAIDFVMQHDCVPFHESVQMIVGNVQASGAAPEKRHVNCQQPEDEWQPITPVPDDAPPPPMGLGFGREPDAHWPYLDEDGKVIGYIRRFNKAGGKKIIMPLSYCTNSETGAIAWQSQAFDKPRPIYGLDKLAKHPSAQVIGVEGEKACDKAQERYEVRGISRDKLITISWPGGTGGARYVDWSPLAGRSVGLWPDADRHVYKPGHQRAGEEMPLIEQPGTACMIGIANQLVGIAKSVKVIAPPTGVFDGWDLGDDLPEGFDLLAHTKANAVEFVKFREQNAAATSTAASEPAPEQPATPTTGEHVAPQAADVGAGASKKGRRAASWDAVAEINQQHSLALMGDKVVVLRETIGESGGKELLFMSVGAFKTWNMNKFVPVETTNNDGAKTTKNTPVADVWLKSDRRRQYEGVTFSPSNNAPANHYNLWSGYAVEPLDCGLFSAAMKCRRLLTHMKSNLCGGNREHFRYLLAWAADMLQDPDRKKGVALIMRGMKGTGKSTFADALKALLGRHAIKVAHMRHLTGNFNRHLADKLLVVAEESFWAGDKADEGPLKDMITSPTLTVEAKGIDAVEMRSLCRVVMITNSDWAVPASTDERRYFVLDVSDRRRQDFKYFAAIEEQLVNGGLNALLTVLLSLPLDKANLRKVPETLALRKQRALSLEPHDQFVFDALADGTLLGDEWRSDVPVGKDDLYDAYVDSSRKRGKTHLLTKATFGQKFMHATGASPTRLWNNGARLQAYKLLSRSDAAEIFTKRLGVDVDLLDIRG